MLPRHTDVDDAREGTVRVSHLSRCSTDTIEATWLRRTFATSLTCVLRHVSISSLVVQVNVIVGIPVLSFGRESASQVTVEVWIHGNLRSHGCVSNAYGPLRVQPGPVTTWVVIAILWLGPDPYRTPRLRRMRWLTLHILLPTFLLLLLLHWPVCSGRRIISARKVDARHGNHGRTSLRSRWRRPLLIQTNSNTSACHVIAGRCRRCRRFLPLLNSRTSSHTIGTHTQHFYR